MPIDEPLIFFKNLKLYSKFSNNKLPFLLTFAFFLFSFYLSFFHHPIWTEQDGIIYLNWGRTILDGNAKNVTITNGQVGAPIFYAFLESIFHDAFAVSKIISIFSGSGIVLLSFFITKHFFNFKIAFLTQLFFAFNPRLFHLSTQALNELMPVFFIMLSLFFITKKNPTNANYVIVGILLGIASIFRLQASFVLVAILIFILFKNKNFKNNILSATLICTFFIISFSPQIIYNYNTYGILLDSHPNYYLSNLYVFQTPQWHNQVANTYGIGISDIFFIDPGLFLKNYFYNLLFHNPDRLFNFNTIDNLSIIPLIPYLGLIPFFSGLIYYIRGTLNLFSKIIILSSFLLSLCLILFLGNFHHHSFLLIVSFVIPLIFLNFKNIKNNFIPVMLLPIVFLPLISIIPVYRSYHLFPLWLPIAIFSAIFFLDIVPRLFFQVKSFFSKNAKFHESDFKLLIFLILGTVLIMNVGFTYKLIDASFFGNTSKEINFKNEFSNLIKKRNFDSSILEIQNLIKFLSEQPNIESSYIMTSTPVVPYHVNSYYIFSDFSEGLSDDTLNDFISRKNWSESEIFRTTVHSYPPIRLNQTLPLPDYLIYQPYVQDPENSGYLPDLDVSKKLRVLLNPENPEIPLNFQVIYRSNLTDMIVYKIDHEK